MRLIHTTRLELQPFLDDSIPDYVILSHTWGDEEVTLQDLQNGTAQPNGWQKIVGACAQAARDEYDWVWIDSCCIDQSSSSELQEAINSMWNWYQQANICYVYLSDIKNAREGLSDAFQNSRWWTRGWTLQELIAPASLEFYAHDWSFIGTKSSMIATIHQITNIAWGALNSASLTNSNAAEKMSWIAHRRTTRPEDMAYCLMGILGVNMSVIYGEGGPKAFRRLQAEVLHRDGDPTIFLFATGKEMHGYTPLLASSPSQFCRCDQCRYADPQRTILRRQLLPASATYDDMQVERMAFTPFNRNLGQIHLAVRPPEINLCSDGCIRGIFDTIVPRSFITTPADELAEEVVWVVLNVSELVEVGEFRDSSGRFYAIPIFHLGGDCFKRLHSEACLVSIEPEPEGWSSSTPLLIMDMSRSPSVDVTLELSNNNQFSIVYDTVDFYDTNGGRNRSEGPLVMRWDGEDIRRHKFWVVQFTRQPECFLIFSVNAGFSTDIPIIVRNRVRPFSGSFEALRRHVTEIESGSLGMWVWRAESSAESSVVRIEGYEVSVRVRRMASRRANRARLDLDSYFFRYKVHLVCLSGIV
jgi:hypothetical protein